MIDAFWWDFDYSRLKFCIVNLYLDQLKRINYHLIITNPERSTQKFTSPPNCILLLPSIRIRKVWYRGVLNKVIFWKKMFMITKKTPLTFGSIFFSLEFYKEERKNKKKKRKEFILNISRKGERWKKIIRKK